MRWVTVALVVFAACGGSDWTEIDSPDPEGLSTYTLWVYAEDDVWLGGRSVWNFDGSEWTETPLPVESGILDFWGFAPDDLWAVGGSHVFHWNGTAWSEMPSGDAVSFVALTVVWGSSSDDMWVANSNNSRIYHFDGTAWTQSTLQFVFANAMWGSSASDIWLTGITSAYRWDGIRWSVYESSNFSEPSGAYGLWGFGPNDVWAAGGRDDLSHWDGTEWSAVEGDFGSYNGLWGSSSDRMFAVGNHGDVAYYDGSRWNAKERQLSVRQNFTMVHGSSDTNVWATAVDLSDFTAMVLRYQP